MTDRPLVLVTGAAAPVGAGVARHLLASGRYRVRVLVPDPLAPAARRLAAAGVEVAAGDAADRPRLRAALAGCYGVFATPDAAAAGGAPDPGVALVHTVAGAEVEHLLLATLPGTRAEEEAERLELPATFLHLALPYDCFAAWRRAAWSPAEAAETPVAAVALADLGGIALGLLDHPAEHLGARLPVVGDHQLPRRYTALLAAAAADRAAVAADRPAGEAADEIPGRPPEEDLAAVVDRRCPPAGGRAAQIAACRRLYPGLRDFAAWAASRAAG